MEHSAKDGSAKLVRACTLPLTAQRCVSVVVTELALFEFVDGVLTLQELAPGVDLTTVREKTEAVFAISPDLKTMPIDTH
jgi:acetate CoA/acetoacetate CoA-transferase beta subunit